MSRPPPPNPQAPSASGSRSAGSSKVGPPHLAPNGSSSRSYAPPSGSSSNKPGFVAPTSRTARPAPPNSTGSNAAVPRPQSNVGARLLKKRQSVAYHNNHHGPGGGGGEAVPAVPSLPNLSFSQPQASSSSSAARGPPQAGSQLAPPVPGSTGRVPLQQQQQQQQLVTQRTQGENQLFATGLDVDQLASEGFKPEDFLKSSLPGGNDEGAARMEDLRRLKNQVESAQKITESELQRSVFNNYADFVIISKEIATLENEMLELKGVLEEWRAVPESLEGGWGGDDDLLIGGSNRRNARNSIADLATLYKSQLSALWEGVEGAQKFLPYVPGRHIITEASTFIELHAATYKPKQAVHLFLLNDAMLVSVKKRRGPGIGGAVRLVAERCFNLSEIVVVDLKDGGDLQNAVKIKRGKETIIFRTDKAEDKKMLLLAFKKVAEELMNKKRKEMLSEAEARKGDPRHDYEGSFASSEFRPSSILGFGKDDPTGKDLGWIGDYSDELSVAISTRSFEDAVVLVEKGKTILPQIASNSHASYSFRTKLDSRTSELVSSLLQDLSDPSLRKTGVVGTTGWLLRLGQGERARETFLTARGTLLRKRARQIKFEGDISMYISELAMVCFTLIKNTCEWYMAAFKDNRMASGFVRWASAQVEIYAEIFGRQVYGADQDGRVIEESLEVTKAQGAMLRDVGLDFSFLLDGLLRPPPKPSASESSSSSKSRLQSPTTSTRHGPETMGEETQLRPNRQPGAAIQMARQSIYQSSQGLGQGSEEGGRPPVPPLPAGGRV
ncbi:exocyst subunit EXO84 [Sporobolomyces salmoneus]|uniref:exocyst subunit EXO84 n=1 Tax=Sporobolomyces salmoneus TaxID=183962 RepID=UPI0031741741